jgi:hypothetical protein
VVRNFFKGKGIWIKELSFAYFFKKIWRLKEIIFGNKLKCEFKIRKAFFISDLIEISKEYVSRTIDQLNPENLPFNIFIKKYA